MLCVDKKQLRYYNNKMPKTTVVNINTNKDFDVYIGRAGHGMDGYFGNPFTVGTRTSRINNFEKYAIKRINNDPDFRTNVKQLYGKRLGCFCHPLPCHGDVLAKLAEKLNMEDEVFD